MATEFIYLDGVEFRFTSLSLRHEDEYRDWLRGRLMREAYESSAGWESGSRAAYLASLSLQLAGGKTGFQSEIGVEAALTDAEAKLWILSAAAAPNHPSPGIPRAVLEKMLAERQDQVENVILTVMPIPAQLRLGLQKKITEIRTKRERELASLGVTTSAPSPSDTASKPDGPTAGPA